MSWVDPRNHVYIRWGPDLPWKGAILRGRACLDMPDDTAMSCVKTAEPIKMSFGSRAQVGSGNYVLNGPPDPHIGGAIIRRRACLDMPDNTLM